MARVLTRPVIKQCRGYQPLSTGCAMRVFFVIMLYCLGAPVIQGQTNNKDFNIVSICTGLKGYTYYVSGSFVKESATGWKEDSLSEFFVLLIQWNETREYDLFYVSPLSAGKIMPFTLDGANVSYLKKLDPDGHLFSVIYEKERLTEIGTYHFDLNFMNNGRLLFALQRRNGAMNSMQAMTGLCVGRETVK